MKEKFIQNKFTSYSSLKLVKEFTRITPSLNTTYFQRELRIMQVGITGHMNLVQLF